MNIVFLMIPMAIIFGLLFLGFFIISVRSGQYDDLDSPAQRLLLDDLDQQNDNDRSSPITLKPKQHENFF